MTHIKDLFSLRGKVALVTSGSRGLGQEIAEGLGEAGAKVIITARREQWLTQAEKVLQEAGLVVTAETCDVTEPTAVALLINGIIEREGSLDIVVNNAGVSWAAPAEEMSVERFRYVLDTNTTSTFLVSQAAARHMLQKRSGVIINTASVAGLVGESPEVLRAVGYNASKGAVIALTRQLATEWAGYNIRVNAIAPGFFPSRMSEGVIAHSEPLMRADVPLGRLGQMGEIKGAVVFLASEAASYITGQVLVVDGGATAW